jgi:uncharacterized membrane protein YhaH (DUF805 family)
LALNYAALLLSRQGRLRRRLYWRATLVLVAVWLAAPIIPRVGLVVGGVVSLAAVWCFICIYTRRLHDLGRSGWWQVVGWLGAAILTAVGVIGAMPVLGHYIESRRQGGDALFALGDASGAFGLIALGMMFMLAFHIWLGVVRGMREANRFGPDPCRPLDLELFD